MSFFRSLLMLAADRPYTPLGYLESTGSQYIVLPFGFDPTDEVEVTGFFRGAPTGDRYLVGTNTWNSPDKTRFALCGISWSGAYPMSVCGYFGSGAATLLPKVVIGNTNEEITATYANANFGCRGSVGDTSALTFAAQSSAPIALFKSVNNNLTPNGCIKSFHHLKANHNEVNLIPVLWNAGAPYIDGNTGATVTPSAAKPGMYDTISGKLFVNQDSGAEFLFG